MGQIAELTLAFTFAVAALTVAARLYRRLMGSDPADDVAAAIQRWVWRTRLMGHDPSYIGEDAPWCLSCRQEWPCDVAVAVEEEMEQAAPR